MPIDAFYRIDANTIEVVRHYATALSPAVSVLGAGAAIGNLAINIKNRRDAANEKRTEQIDNALRRWFYPHRVDGPASVVQPAKHPNTPPAQKVSKSGNEVWQAYLPFANGVKCIRDSLQVPESDGMVLVAALLAALRPEITLKTRIHHTRPEFTVIDPAGQWKTSLTWAFYTPSRPANTVYPFVYMKTGMGVCSARIPAC